jgi:putative NADH-flavin reductase
VVNKVLKMKVVVFGASGRTGKPLVEQALAAGHEVTAFVRDRAKLALQHPKLTIVQGDSSNAAQVESAVAGADAVLSVLGPVKDSPKDMLQTAGRNIIAAMKRHGVRRLVLLTGAGVRDAQDQPKLIDHIFGFLLRLTSGDVLKDSEAGVNVVRSSDVDWTIVRGPRLMDSERRGRYKVGYVGKDSGTQISRADVADFMLKQVTDKAWLRKMPMVSD